MIAGLAAQTSRFVAESERTAPDTVRKRHLDTVSSRNLLHTSLVLSSMIVSNKDLYSGQN